MKTTIPARSALSRLAPAAAALAALSASPAALAQSGLEAMAERLIDSAAAPIRFGIPDTAALLERLEEARGELTTLRASVHYRREFAIAGDEQVRKGELFFADAKGEAEVPGAGIPERTQFAMRFTQLIVGERLERQDQLYVFDGEWLVEKVESDKRFVKRQVAPPGSTFDPLRVGEGPFPIPLGQSPAEITARYDAELRPATEALDPDDGLHSFAESGLVQLKLVPKAEFAESEDLSEIRVWFDARTEAMIPRIARTETATGDVSLIVLVRLVVNEALPAEAFDTATPPREEGWNVTVSPYRRPAERPGGGDRP